MSDLLIYTLLAVAAAVGFALGRLSPGGRRSGSKADAKWLQHRYFEGLNHLLNEQPDAAIDTFVDALEVNSETLETHFALGSLLRRRGEVERAVRVHQNLLARPSLTPQQQQQVQSELALDYMKSGLLDRAEALFKELSVTDDLVVRGLALERLVEIYRDEKEWESAIAMAEHLCHRKLSKDPGQWRELQAHFSCELAEQALRPQGWLAARQWAERALEYRKDSVRARLDLGRLEMNQQRFEAALAQFLKIPTRSPFFVPDILPHVEVCYQSLGRVDEQLALVEQLYREQPTERLLQKLWRLLYAQRGESAARDLLAQELPRFPNLAPMASLLDMLGEQAGCQLDYERLAPILDRSVAANHGYECHQCGFTGQELHWCCPTCKTWGAVTATANAAPPLPAHP